MSVYAEVIDQPLSGSMETYICWVTRHADQSKRGRCVVTWHPLPLQSLYSTHSRGSDKRQEGLMKREGDRACTMRPACGGARDGWRRWRGRDNLHLPWGRMINCLWRGQIEQIMERKQENKYLQAGLIGPRIYAEMWLRMSLRGWTMHQVCWGNTLKEA